MGQRAGGATENDKNNSSYFAVRFFPIYKIRVFVYSGVKFFPIMVLTISVSL